MKLRELFDFIADDLDSPEVFNRDQLGSGLLSLGAPMSDSQLVELFDVMSQGEAEEIGWELFQEFMKIEETNPLVNLVQGTINIICQKWLVNEHKKISEQQKEKMISVKSNRDGFFEMIQKLETSEQLEEQEIIKLESEVERIEKKLARANLELQDIETMIEDNEGERHRKMRRARIKEPDESMKNDIFTADQT